MEPPAALREAPWRRIAGIAAASGLLAVLVLGVALGVIAVVMLVAAGVPAPWQNSATDRPRPPAVMPGSASASPAPLTRATSILEDGRYQVGTDLRPGRYVTEGGVSCHWARLRENAGAATVVAEGNGAGRTVVWIRKADSAFETTGCTIWTRR